MNLTFAELTLPKEKTYFTVSMVISIILWLLIVGSVIGILYALIVGLVVWLTHGLLIARLKSESILIQEHQYPELYASYREVCSTLQVTKIPELYILQAGGLLNAFATRHSGRNFVVVYSGFLEACGPDTPQIKFLLGHEIGHIQRQHLPKHLLLLPSLILPLLGPAYRRACEATCDRFGAFAAAEPEGALKALLMLAGGKEAAQRVEPARFAIQHHETRGFFISWHELISGYPTLSQRVSNILALEDAQYAQQAPRNPLAYVCAFFFTWRTVLLAYLAFIIIIALGQKVPMH